MEQTRRDRNDWLVLLLFLLLGIVLMLYAGRKGTQLLRTWNLRADVSSNLDPRAFQVGDSQGLAPLRPEILTPPAWGDSYLTPQGDQAGATPPTFVVFDPSATASATPSPPATATVEPSLTVTTTTTVTVTVTTTRTKKPGDDPTPTATATATSTGFPSTIDPALTEISPPPADLEVGPPDDTIADLPENTYTVVDLSVSGKTITVTDPSETNYDMIFYEYNNGGVVQMDQIIIGISQYADGSIYYVVFNWGDGVADTNTNVGDVAGNEDDNQVVPITELYGTPPTDTGILIDVDNAASNPPPGNYNYVVIISPPVTAQSPPAPPDDTSAQVDSIDVVEVPP